MNVQRTLRIWAGLAACLVLPTLVHAGAPQIKTQAPGYYRMTLGDFEITALCDGTFMAPLDKLLTNTTPAKTSKALAAAFLSNPVETSVNAFLINTGTKLVLVDTGAGTYFVPTTGNLLVALKAAGYAPEQIDEVYITHMHSDHIGGLVSGGKLTFPNAIVRADKHESDYWVSQAHLDAAPADDKGGYQHALESLGPYIAAGKFKPFEGDTELVPGIRALASHGHTPGHTTYVIESKGQKLALWGDLMHVAAVQFPTPSVTIAFDTDSKAAAVQREKAFLDAAKNGYWVAAAHLPFPAIGHLRTSGTGYTWVPANYSVLR
jgi:glyoxylase-like metal-dependent hydrolase (beta-lactamase superfamily II)